MAVAFDAFTTCRNTSVSSVSWTHTPSGTPTGIVLQVAQAFSDTAPSSVAYGSDTPVLEVYNGGNGDYNARIYGCPTSLTGAQTVTVTWASSKDVAVCGATTVTGSDSSDIFSNNVGGSGTDNPSVTCTSATDELVIDLTAMAALGTLTVDGSQTEILNVDTGGMMKTASSYEAGAASVVMSWTWSISGFGWRSVAVSVRAAAAGGSVVQSGGASTVTAASAKLDAQPISVAGSATVVARGQANSEAMVTAAGQAAASILASAQSAAPVAIAGVATVNVVGNASAAGQTAAQAAGFATVNITGSALSAAQLQAAGEADVRVVGVPTGTGQDYLLWGSRLREDAKRRARIEQEDEEVLRVVRTELAPRLLRRSKTIH